MATLTPLRLLFFSVFMCYFLQLSVSAKPTVGFNSTSSTEPEALRYIQIYIERTVETNVKTKVSLDLAGTAMMGQPIGMEDIADYSVASSSLNVIFPQNKTSKFIAFFILHDQVVENVETIVITIRNDSSAYDIKAGFSSHTVYIKDDDVSINCTSTPVSESAGTAAVTITRSGSPDALSATHSIRCSTKDGTAVQPRDYTTHNTDLSFSSGNDIKKINITIEDNDFPDGNKNLNVSCSTNDTRVQIQNSCKDAVVTIQNDDTYAFFCPGGYAESVFENAGSYSVEICRVGVLPSSPIVKLCRISDGGPQASITEGCENVTFTANSDRISATINITDDTVGENELKTFQIYLESSDPKVKINDTTHKNITLKVGVNFIRCANESIEVSEGNKTVYFTLKREGVLNKASPIWFSTKDGTAFDKADYKPQNKVNKTFLPGQVYMTLNVDLVDDGYNEDNETFSVIIGSYVPTTLTSGDNCTLFTIKDNDPNRMTEQQAQELLVRRRKFLIILGVAGAFLTLAIMLFLCCICYLLRQQICRPGDHGFPLLK